jgi:hypothetical protein
MTAGNTHVQAPSPKAPDEAKLRRREAGVWLKTLRQRAGMSQIQLAERLG